MAPAIQIVTFSQPGCTLWFLEIFVLICQKLNPMKMKSRAKWNLLLLLVSPFFIFGLCNTDDDEGTVPDYLNADEYFSWNISGYNGSLKSPSDSIQYLRNSGNNIFVAYNSVNSVNSYVSFDGPQSPGTYSSYNFLVYTGSKYFVSTTTPVVINITNFGTAGQPITGTYSGNVRDSANTTTFAVTGNFKVKNQ
jgi:hypothetical protein